MIWDNRKSHSEIVINPNSRFRSNCYLCGNQGKKVVFIENRIPIVECLGCEHVYSTYIQKEHYNEYWGTDSKEYDLLWWDHAHREIYRDFCDKFLHSPSGRILDVGCGLGFFIRKIRQERPGWDAVGYEISEEAVRFAKEKNLLTNVYSGVVQESDLPEESFDIITLWDVIEHIPNPQSLLEYLHSLLKPGGFIFIETPNFPVQLIKARMKVLLLGRTPKAHYLEAKDHINNYKEKTLTFLAKSCGFSDVTFTMLKPISFVAGNPSKLGVIAKKCIYYASKFLHFVSLKKWNINLTLFAVVSK
ncbi:methyltransferase domain-containing protein [Leptospira fluminis]|uniref:Methyltransferase domain-containing protein n=1 Tax=Leptospira fluminis TaxID=2484979 RepID=A0A4R9GLV0_9LEPT|nr:methyltransferase domain-containing protein [Leptospira fluminis]